MTLFCSCYYSCGLNFFYHFMEIEITNTEDISTVYSINKIHSVYRNNRLMSVRCLLCKRKFSLMKHSVKRMKHCTNSSKNYYPFNTIIEHVKTKFHIHALTREKLTNNLIMINKKLQIECESEKKGIIKLLDSSSIEKTRMCEEYDNMLREKDQFLEEASAKDEKIRKLMEMEQQSQHDIRNKQEILNKQQAILLEDQNELFEKKSSN